MSVRRAPRRGCCVPALDTSREPSAPGVPVTFPRSIESVRPPAYVIRRTAAAIPTG
jgi:hypothetical protein